MPNYTSKTTGDEVARDCKSQIANKTILVTGATPGGLGATFATTIAPYGPAVIILASHSVVKAGDTAKAIEAISPDVKTIVIELDLASISQVRKAAENILGCVDTIDVIVNNAGIMAAPYSKTVDGIESQFGTNHVGHFLLTNLLLSSISRDKKKRPLRVVNVSSNGFRFSPVRIKDISFDDGATYDRWTAYGQSKSANMLFSRSLAAKLGSRGVISISLHPGVIIETSLSRHVAMEDFAELGVLDRKLGNREFWDQPFMLKSPAEGVATHIFAAFHPALEKPEHNGAYLEDSQVVDAKQIQSWARDAVEAQMLWRLSEEMVSETFSY
ncbi:short-chain dehydrogenase [Sporothrix schenckii 1099-18]|uniref:Oxidoreductase n=2 Tax=Sporothrix schenckii TaxID=29908 RepID=U7PVD5_SPOS1|nr:short-chain dehydrogenase [Sporothrix schenckii 1099-18]ERS99618.1 hypothetical protein HMPREF1624_02978 [Sporothrix schenckii ATCC 58251]KJR86035.1 short-chain dehydrogenase [Sporothrix schenckii 1099-18]